MDRLLEQYEPVDLAISSRMGRFGIPLLRICLGVSFFWFGLLKISRGLSPAQELAPDTISLLTLGLIQPELAITNLALWETAVGLGLIAGIALWAVLLLLFLQMLGTLTPLFIFTEWTLVQFPYAPTLQGQYIVKYLMLISAGPVVGATVGGRIVHQDHSRRQLNSQPVPGEA